MDEMQKFYDGIAETLDTIPNEKFAIWYLLRGYVKELSERLNVTTDTYEMYVLRDQIKVLNLTIDILADELF